MLVNLKLKPEQIQTLKRQGENFKNWINTEDGDLLGLGPLMIKNKRITISSSNSTALNGDSGCQFHVIKLVRQGYENNGIGPSYHLEAHHERLQLVQLVLNDNKGGVTLFV